MQEGRKSLVKNRAPAPIQITAEQILREATDRTEKEHKPPRQQITDPEELQQVKGQVEEEEEGREEEDYL